MSKTDEDRPALIVRWFELTRTTLPAMAKSCRWPISLDHCFMRVCLDAVCGAPWTASVPAPAIRNLSIDGLTAAIAVAESIVQDPDLLLDLNQRSLEGRASYRRLTGQNSATRRSPSAESS